MEKFIIKLSKLEGHPSLWAKNRRARMEFHIKQDIRAEYNLEGSLFSLTGNVVLADVRKARELTAKFNAGVDPSHPERFIRAGQLFAMGLIDEIMHYVVALYRQQMAPDAFDTCLARLENKLGEKRTENLLDTFSRQFPPYAVYAGEKNVGEYLEGSDDGENCRALSLEETMFLSLANQNPAFKPFMFLFDDKNLAERTIYPAAIEEIKTHFKEFPQFGRTGQNLWDLLCAPALASPDSLLGQLEYMRKNWGLLISKYMSRLLTSLDVIKEEEKPVFFGPGPSQVLSFAGLDEYERFSPDLDWMPQTVLMAKSTLVWLSQLSKKYKRDISRLDQIPDEELDELARRGFTGLWLIGLWERSKASRTIKQWTGNPEAAASAYSLYDYDIAGELGGWGALTNLRERCIRRGVRLGSDMVPNHTGIDSRWIIEHPDRFLQLSWPPFPNYNYTCENLSGRNDITVQIEDHYFNRSDAAVVFKRIDNQTGETRYIYHGNDGTSMPWNDTAQIDFLNPEAREAVIRTIVGVCKQFSIVRFDAAMTLAKRHIQRLWYPAPGHGGAIASRAEHAISGEEFNRRIPNEFWREVVDRCAAEAPNTLLLAEAFWMMEGYFVRTLGMHRVYNSAFMNMLKNEENAKYRATIKNTLEFDPEILKRFVNFMNNPDEETAVAQFGKGDKYFGICTLLVTMPGLPMFGHGQIEGFEEKYGMEYRCAYRDEQPDMYFVDRHEREIFPLMKIRALFSGSANFRLYDLFSSSGSVNENVFAYSNKAWINGIEERALAFYNNCYYECSGWIKISDPAIPQSDGSASRDDMCAALGLHRSDSYFVLLREHRSNLWYIRSSKDLSENGFYITLKGYEAQIFLNIHEVENDKRGKWSRLNNDLQGKGVPDLEAAIMDIFLGELYYRFTELVKPEIIIRMHELLSNTVIAENDKISKNVMQFIAGLKLPAQAFFAAAAHFMNGADGMYDHWIPPDETGAPLERPRPDSEEQWKLFADMISGILNPAEQAGQQLPLCAALVGCGAALGYAALSSLRAVIGRGAEGACAVSLGFTHWQLDRKLRAILQSIGAGDGEAVQITGIMRAFLERAPAAGSFPRNIDFNQTGIAARIIQENYLVDDFRNILGINVFDDVTWFNKEKFEGAVHYAALFSVLELNGQCGRLAEFSQALLRTSIKSGYRFNNFMELILNNDIEPANVPKNSKKQKTTGRKNEH